MQNTQTKKYESWSEIEQHLYNIVADFSPQYLARLKFEISEINKQGANAYWLGIINSGKTFKNNPNKLLIPFLFDLVEEDPILSRDSELIVSSRVSDVKAYVAKYGKMPFDLIKDQDMPDIDIDCLPEARDPIKEHATEKFGAQINNDEYGPVCSVGTWQTYKFKSAIMDVSRALAAVDQAEVYELTTKLPEDVDALKDGGYAVCKNRVIDFDTNIESECGFVHKDATCPKCQSSDTESPTIGKLLLEYENLRDFNVKYPQVIEYAVKLVGRVRNMGMHAGALIIADRSLFGNIPLAKNSGKGYWVSMWTEGRNTQLSKFGYYKWDFLGLKTLEYIFKCSKLIELNRGISFGANANGWEDIDPTQDRAGHYFDGDGNKKYISLNDPHALALANDQKTDGVFQFDTDLAKSILANGVRNFNDLLFFNAAGHPGPMAAIPEAVANRDDTAGLWKKRLANIHPELLDILKDTYGIILWQEQLAAIWQRLAGFTSPEAQEARKAVAKKWTHKLKPIGEKWLAGAAPNIGLENAKTLWESMVSFGRYAFNRSHGVAYCLMAFRCLWLKAHFAPEWWAAVMSDCHPDKLVRYMSVARAEDWKPTDITYSGKFKPEKKASGVKFGTININNLTVKYTVTGDVVNQGLIGIKKVGEKAAEIFAGKGNWQDIDEFVIDDNRKNKVVLERFIKLGAFSGLPNHTNSFALWQWYQYKYCSGMTQFKADIKAQLLKAEGWNDKTIQEERQRQISEYKKAYPNRRKIPPKFNNWMPKPNDSRQNVMALFPTDFTSAQKLEFQKEFLGYYLDSPLELFNIKGGRTIKDAKINALQGEPSQIEVMILAVEMATTKPKDNRGGTQYAKVTVTDGIQRTIIFIWGDELGRQDPNNLQIGTGIRMTVNYDKMRGTFSMCRKTNIIRLSLKDDKDAIA